MLALLAGAIAIDWTALANESIKWLGGSLIVAVGFLIRAWFKFQAMCARLDALEKRIEVLEGRVEENEDDSVAALHALSDRVIRIETRCENRHD